MSSSEWLDRFEVALSARAGASSEDAVETEAQVALAHVAGQDVPVPEDELKGAVRRALLVLASGGDPSRSLDLGGPAVDNLADELDSPFRRKILADGLEALRVEAGERAAVVGVVESLQGDQNLAWRAFSVGRLIDALERDELADD